MRKPQQSATKLLQTKSLAYAIVKMSQEFSCPPQKLIKYKVENIDIVILPSCFFITLNSKSIGRI